VVSWKWTCRACSERDKLFSFNERKTEGEKTREGGLRVGIMTIESEARGVTNRSDELKPAVKSDSVPKSMASELLSSSLSTSPDS
jgi:hypothetical protein